MEIRVVVVVAVSRYDGDDDVGDRLGRYHVRVHRFSVSSVQYRQERLLQIKSNFTSILSPNEATQLGNELDCFKHCRSCQ